jgi:aspartate-semialdehyde dehydrogenase
VKGGNAKSVGPRRADVTRRVAVLGASGLVGQRLQQRLARHPEFELAAVVGSPRTAGQNVHDLPWGLEGSAPEVDLPPVLDASDPSLGHRLRSLGVSWAFSALPSAVAVGLEPALVEAGVNVCSNASAYRRRSGVPLVVGDLNPQHLAMQASGTLHACATNCTLIPLLFPYVALAGRFGPLDVTAQSEQARSGAGYALLRRQVPFTDDIPGEAEKTVAELGWITGELSGAIVLPSEPDVRLRCRRVDADEGHIIDATVRFGTEVNIDEVREALTSFTSRPEAQGCPSAPARPLMVVDGPVRRTDHLWADGDAFDVPSDPATSLRSGMAVVVGDLRQTGPSTVHLRALSHNTVRGAAGGVTLLAEVALRR